MTPRSSTSDPQAVIEPAYFSGGIPVFEPTMSQFSDFYSYNKAINKYGMQSGIVKIVPPTEWLAELENTYTQDNLSSITIKNPIVQNMNITAGHKGVYSSQNVERQRKYNIFQWKQLSTKQNHVPPSVRKNRRGSDPEDTDAKSCTQESRGRDRRKELIDTILQQDFNIDVAKYTPERCKELETLYWKSLGYAEPMYGADMLGSLFTKDTSCWNVAELPNVLDLMDEKLPGVNDAYLYAGLWKATFSWHLEDQDLYSINYLHFGAPKQWYSIPQKENDKFYGLMKEIFHEEYQNCSEFLRHKTFLASPDFLEKSGISCNKIVHNQGEFIITYPYGYHAGFNFDFNLAESVNFALDDWFPFAEKTKKCECIKDSVSINHRQIYCKFKGIPYTPAEELANIRPLDVQMDIADEVPRPGKRGRKPKKRPKLDITYDCELCPNNLPPSAGCLHKFELLDIDSEDQTKVHKVHRTCAESFRKQVKIENVNGKDTAHGLGSIENGFCTLKCTFCASDKITTKPHGACFQCSEAKCTRSAHATCAVAGGFDMAALLCKFHRGNKGMNLEKLAPDALVQFQLSQAKRTLASVFCGVVLRNFSDEQTLEVLVYPAMREVMEVHYSYVIGSETLPPRSKRPRAIEQPKVVSERNVSPTESPNIAPVPPIFRIQPPILYNQPTPRAFPRAIPQKAVQAAPTLVLPKMPHPIPQATIQPAYPQLYQQNVQNPYPPMPPMARFAPMPPHQAPPMFQQMNTMPPVFQPQHQPRQMQTQGHVFINEFSDRASPSIPGINQFRFVPENH